MLVEKKNRIFINVMWIYNIRLLLMDIVAVLPSNFRCIVSFKQHVTSSQSAFFLEASKIISTTKES